MFDRIHCDESYSDHPLHSFSDTCDDRVNVYNFLFGERVILEKMSMSSAGKIQRQTGGDMIIDCKFLKNVRKKYEYCK